MFAQFNTNIEFVKVALLQIQSWASELPSRLLRVSASAALYDEGAIDLNLLNNT